MLNDIKYKVFYNSKEVGESCTYAEANTIAHLYGNGIFEDIIIIDTCTGEIITKL